MPISKSADSRNAYREISRFHHKYPEGSPVAASVEIREDLSEKRKLYDLLEDGINDIQKGHILTEEEMDKELDMM
ncbi:MAG: antitoxin PHD [Spirochaetaceae bacterium]|nr:antitoxin PHD [Spirochaetaceae bacterium]